MAHSKSKNRRQNNEYQVQREANDFSNRRLLGTKKYYSTSRLTDFEDRRTFHPQGSQRPARSFNRSIHRLSVAGIPVARAVRPAGSQYDFRSETWKPLPYRVGFEKPHKVLICVRRKIRKEVLHALSRSSGFGSLGKLSKMFKAPKRNEYSSIHC